MISYFVLTLLQVMPPKAKAKAAGKKRRMRCRLGAAVALVVPGLGWEVLFLVPFPGP